MKEPNYSKHAFLKKLGLAPINNGVICGKDNKANGETIMSLNPHDNSTIAQTVEANILDYERLIIKAEKARKSLIGMPMPKRGEILRQVGNAFRDKKEDLGRLISLEMGKILAEGIGEVQEVIDICDYAVGLSRTIKGQVLQSERKDHILLETWNPLGIIGVITAFNFPNAVLGWNFAISFVCGNCTIWKGASSTALVTIATAKIINEVLEKNSIEEGVFSAMVAPGSGVGETMLNDKKLQLISFTGSTKVGKHVSSTVHGRFGKTILELGGNNALIICKDADVEMAIKAVVFGAVGTCGQRCTSTRRLFVHNSLFNSVKNSLLLAYKTIIIGDPLNEKSHCGPLHTKKAVNDYLLGIKEMIKQGGKVIIGGDKVSNMTEGNYVLPTIVEIDPKAKCVQEELFAPVLYLFSYENFEDVVKLNNNVPQGLSSAVFTKDMQKVFSWVGPSGSDCGIVNVNAGTSGAEIGGAFGGEKETGGGRESGSDAWKQYMRRSTCTVNFGKDMPLSQGINFGAKL